MKLLLVISALVLSAYATSDADEWSSFKILHSKSYRSLLEEKRRFTIFQSNLRTIEEHNAKYERGEVTYFLKINQFADLTDEEFSSYYLNYRQTDVQADQTFQEREDDVVPDAIDWRDKGVVVEVKNQGQCGSCWAFSTTGAIETHHAIKHGEKISLSEEQLVECSDVNEGCAGGNMMRAFVYVNRNGIATEESYPYTSGNGSYGRCKKWKPSGVAVTAITRVRDDENVLKKAVGTVGPVSIGINGAPIKLYGGGIFNDPTCKPTLNHGVLAVGYGTKDDLDYWIVKNSWGAAWGESGYIKMARNKDQQCGISLDNTYPTVR